MKHFFTSHVIIRSMSYVIHRNTLTVSHKGRELSKKYIYIYYKSGQACVTNQDNLVLLQIRANIVTHWSKCCYKLKQLLQIRTTFITKYSNCYQLELNLLQTGEGIAIRAIITNLGITTCFLILAELSQLMKLYSIKII